MLMIGTTVALPQPRSAPSSEVSRRATCSGVSGSPRSAPVNAATRSSRFATPGASGRPEIFGGRLDPPHARAVRLDQGDVEAALRMQPGHDRRRYATDATGLGGRLRVDE